MTRLLGKGEYLQIYILTLLRLIVTLCIMDKKEAISILKNLSAGITSLLLILFPLLFLTNASDVFTFPKEILVLIFTIALLIILCLKMVFESKITIRSNPFNLPLVFFGVVVLGSSLVSRGFYDSIIQALPLISLLFLYFVVVNSIDNASSFNLLSYSLILGSVLSALVTLLYFAKIYIFPFPETHSRYFNTFGSTVQQTIYILPILLISLFFLANLIKNKVANYELAIFSLSSLFTVLSFAVLIYEILVQKVVTLPFMHGLQIAFASISQDAQRPLLSLILGSGYGTFVTDFTRFRLPSFNLERDIWNLTFFNSSTFFFELIATTGILGIVSYFYLIQKVLKTRLKTINILHLSIIVLLIASFLLPFSFTSLFMLFMLMALYVSYLYLHKSNNVYNVTITLVALKQGLINVVEAASGHRREKESKVLPLLVFVVVIFVGGFVGYYTMRFLISDLAFKQSLAYVSSNNGQKAYDLQRQAIDDYPYRSDYYRVFSQLNFALANSLAASIAQKDSPADAQQTVVALLQQSINSARQAVVISPLLAANWQNLSQIYRNLINVGQNADQFAVATLTQAISLDSSNPQLYVELGGIYYQFKQYDNAQNQFQIATNLKRDYSNAYYNLGHTLEAKGDFSNALAAYQIVRNLSKNDENNLKKINEEINALTPKIQGQGETAEQNLQEEQANNPVTEQQPLQLSSPSANTLPTGPSPMKISPPPSASEAAR